MLDGYAPDGVYDLDTAEKIDIEVSTPIVTRAPHQGRQRESARRIDGRCRSRFESKPCNEPCNEISKSDLI